MLEKKCQEGTGWFFDRKSIHLKHIVCTPYLKQIIMIKISKNIFLLLFAISIVSNAQTPFEEVNGNLTIPAESLTLTGSWAVQNTVAGFNGTGYIVWTGTDSFTTQTATALITTQIKINTPGTYLFKWRNKVGQGTTSTDFNDSWLKFSDATDFFALKPGGVKVYAKGSGKTPNPAGAGTNGFFKIYLNSTTNWTDRAFTFDNDAHSIYVEFASEGVYTMLISARSRLHLIDEIVLTKVTLGLNENLKEDTASIQLYPNPIEKDSVLSVVTSLEKQNIIITDMLGKEVLRNKTSGSTVTQIQLKGFKSGVYFVKTNNTSAKFIVK